MSKFPKTDEYLSLLIEISGNAGINVYQDFNFTIKELNEKVNLLISLDRNGLYDEAFDDNWIKHVEKWTPARNEYFNYKSFYAPAIVENGQEVNRKDYKYLLSLMRDYLDRIYEDSRINCKWTDDQFKVLRFRINDYCYETERALEEICGCINDAFGVSNTAYSEYMMHAFYNNIKNIDTFIFRAKTAYKKASISREYDLLIKYKLLRCDNRSEFLRHLKSEYGIDIKPSTFRENKSSPKNDELKEFKKIYNV